MFSRRDFFTRIGGRVLDHVQDVLAETESIQNQSIVSEKTEWIEIDPISKFQVESKTEIPEHKIMVHSFAAGLQVIDDSGTVREVKLNSRGILMFNPKVKWASQAVLSLMTGQMKVLDDGGKT
jgi:hypothetical protein